MCSQQVDNLSTQVDFVNVDAEYEPSFQLIPPFGEYDYKELVFVLINAKGSILFCANHDNARLHIACICNNTDMTFLLALFTV